jgi:ABC-2 type transport system permease protein
MKRYFNLYLQLIRYSIVRELEFRINFIFKTVIFSIWTLLSYGLIVLIFNFLDSIAGWTKDEVLILNTVFGIMNSLMKATIYYNLTNLPKLVRQGQLDFILCKPVKARFLISLNRFRFEQFIRSFVMIALLGVFLHYYQIQISFFQMIVFFISFLCGYFALYFLLLIISCYSFWKPRIWNLFIIMERIKNMGERPHKIYEGVFAIIVRALPIALIGSIPTMFLIDKGTSCLFIYSIGLLGIFAIISNMTWKSGLLRYESASS